MKYKCAGIVLFNPELERLSENINSILPQVDLLILVDNDSENLRDIILNFDNNNKIIIIKNNINKGIANALNIICEESEKNGYDWVMLLDQDSICSETIINSYSKYLKEDDLSLLTPYIIDTNKISLPQYKKLNLDETTFVGWAITSGSMINLNIWRKIGKFSEELFIDAVDIDYSIRLKINNYKQLRVNKEYLLQEVGRAEKTWLKRLHKDNAGHISIKSYYRSNHSPLRQYYMARNHIILSKKYRLYLPMWKTLPFNFVLIIPKMIFERPKKKIWIKILKGVKDGTLYKTEIYVKGDKKI